MPLETTCMTYGDWKHPMEFFTLLLFPSATLFMLVWAIQKNFVYIIFAFIALGISLLVYHLNYYPKICWNNEKISYHEGDKEVTLFWKDVKTIGGFTSGKYGSKFLSREELVKSSFFTTKYVYITTNDTLPVSARQLRNDEGWILFQYRKGILEEMERLARLKIYE